MVKIKEFLVNHQQAPIGMDDGNPCFSWILASSRESVKQSYYHLVVRSDKGVVWNTLKKNTEQSVGIIYEGEPFEPHTIYCAEIEIIDNHGDVDRASLFFETGIMDTSGFKGEWITHTMGKSETACPVFVKDFSLKDKIARARIYSSACGIYDLSLNGSKVGDEFFTPGWTSYDQRIQYQTYDISEQLRDNNKLEVTIAPGWYSGYYGCDGLNHHYGNQVAAFAEIHIWYENGSKEIIVTDKSWNYCTKEIRNAEIYNGETVDTTWNEERLTPVAIAEISQPKLIAQVGKSVKIIEKLDALELIHTPGGEVVIDFGQNMAGVVEITVNGLPNQKIIIRHAETLDRFGNFYTKNLRSAKATDTFICSGGIQTFRPRFVYHGFRYISVEGMGANPELSNFKACVMHTDMDEVGKFSCSNPLVNRLWENIKWGQKSNFFDIPTDCPQRDERLGWTGDATVFCKTSTHVADVYLFFKKWLQDLALEQNDQTGVPHIVPNILADHGGAAVWSDSATIIPWTMYEMYGEKKILEDQYKSMKSWVEFMRRDETENHLRKSGHQYGDWLALDKEEALERPQGATDPYLIASVFYAYSTRILAQAADVLGYEDDVEEYNQLYQLIKQNFQEEYITKNGRIVGETQTACALILYFDLEKEEHLEQIKSTLLKNLSTHKGKLTTGFIGTPYLMHALTKIGYHELAGKLLLSDSYPGWINEVKLGATTIWERWNSIAHDGSFDESGMNSFNHYSFGAVGEWMMEDLAGIQQIKPGYKEILLKPQFINGLTKVSASKKTPYGVLECSWECIKGQVTIDVQIPVNTTAILHLPETDEIIKLGSGFYQYTYPTERYLEPVKYSLDTTLGELINDPKGKILMEKHMPGTTEGAMVQFAYGKTINELIALVPGSSSQPYQYVIDELNQYY